MCEFLSWVLGGDRLELRTATSDGQRLTGRTGFIVQFYLVFSPRRSLALYWQRHARGLERVTQGVEAIAKRKTRSSY